MSHSSEKGCMARAVKIRYVRSVIRCVPTTVSVMSPCTLAQFQYHLLMRNTDNKRHEVLIVSYFTIILLSTLIMNPHNGQLNWQSTAPELQRSALETCSSLTLPTAQVVLINEWISYTEILPSHSWQRSPQHIGVWARRGGGESGATPSPKIWVTQIFWAVRETWAKPTFTEVCMCVPVVVVIFFDQKYFKLKSAW